MLKGLTVLLLLSLASLAMAQKLELAPEIPDHVQTMIREGEYDKARQALGVLSQKSREPLAEKLRYAAECLDRIRRDFSVGQQELLEKLWESIPDVSEDDLARWRQEGSLWFRKIDGEYRYFRWADKNLFRLSQEARERRDLVSYEMTPYEKHMTEVVKASEKSDSPYLLPQRFQIDYTVTVGADVVPQGETIRCWILYPKECDTQKDIQLLASSPAVKHIAPSEHPQRTLYFEQPAAEKGQPTVFHAVYEYTALACFRNIDPNDVKPYNEETDLYKTYTAERDPHLLLTDAIVATGQEIVAGLNNPYLKARSIFEWIQHNVSYTSMLEYSTVPNLSAWCLKYRQGDCGVQSLLFIALCRARGVPARWQSGWSTKPWEHNMHDWAEIYIEPYGWLPVDASRGFVRSSDPRVRMFHFGNLDHFRLTSNSDYGSELDPPKQHFRSEPVDFQRGEVEWEGGNLYFDKWQYKMEITPK